MSILIAHRTIGMPTIALNIDEFILGIGYQATFCSWTEFILPLQFDELCDTEFLVSIILVLLKQLLKDWRCQDDVAALMWTFGKHTFTRT